MTKQDSEKSIVEKNDDPESDLTRYKISKHVSEYFLIGKYRYSKLEDAVAEGKRQELANGAA